MQTETKPPYVAFADDQIHITMYEYRHDRFLEKIGNFRRLFGRSPQVKIWGTFKDSGGERVFLHCAYHDAKPNPIMIGSHFDDVNVDSERISLKCLEGEEYRFRLF